jgi:hypothetical protein
MNFGGGERRCERSCAFVVAFDEDGVHRWSRTFVPATVPEIISDLTFVLGAVAAYLSVDDDGRLYVTIHTPGDLTFGSKVLAVAGDAASVVAAFDAAGALRWSQIFGGTGAVLLDAAVVHGDELHVGGGFLGELTIAGTHATAMAGNAAWVVLDVQSGDARRFTSIGTAGDDYLAFVDFGGPGGLHFLLRYEDQIDFLGRTAAAPGTSGAIFGALRSSNELRFAQELPPSALPTGMAMGANGRLHLAGQFTEPVDFGGGRWSASGGLDGFIASFDTAPSE